VVLLVICTCTYIRATAPALVDRNRKGYVHATHPQHARRVLQGRSDRYVDAPTHRRRAIVPLLFPGVCGHGRVYRYV